MNVKERLKTYIASQTLNVSDFEKSINVSNGYVNSISKNIGLDKMLLMLEKYPNLNIEWLITCKGDMIKVIPNSNTISTSPNVCEKCLEKEERIKELKEIIETQRKLINYLECERPDCESGQKRKAG